MVFYSRFILLILTFALSCSLSFSQETGVKGKVRTSRNEAIPQVDVTARKDGKDIKSVTTDKSGAFKLTGLDSGVYNIVFDKNGYSTGVLYDVEIKKNNVRDLGNRALMPDEGTMIIIKGIVFDQNGRSVRGANIDVERKQADGTYQRVKTTTTSYGVEPLATGEFVVRFQHDNPTDFRIIASAKGVTVSKELSVVNAAVYRLALTLNIKNEEEKK